MNNPEGIKALVAKWRDEVERGTGYLNDEADRAILSCADELESLTAVAEPEEESRAITALKVTLFETECYLPASIAKRVQAACTVGVAGDAEVVARELLAEEVAAMPRTYEACDYQDEYKAAALRAIRRALNTRQAFETMPAPAPGCDTRHAVTFYFNDKAAAEQFRTRQAVEGMVPEGFALVPVKYANDADKKNGWTLDMDWAMGLLPEDAEYGPGMEETEAVILALLAAAAPQAGKGDGRG